MTSGKKTMMIVVSVMALLSAMGVAQARFREERRVFIRPPEHARRIIISGSPYWVEGGVYYRHDDDGYVVVSAPVVRMLPGHTRVVVVHGVVYYVANDVYYRTTPDGYVVVEPPVEAAPPVVAAKPAVPADTHTLYVPKKAGDGYVTVTLKKVEGGYVGPQGEFYPTMPPIAFLTEMYGLDNMARLERPDTFIIYVPNTDGKGFTRVILTRRDQGFVGPQGEFYPLMPTVAHLAAMYGNGSNAPKTQEAPKPQDAPKAPEAPKVQDTPKADDSIIHIQVPKTNGEGFADVQLKKTDQGYIGPRGELYTDMPTLGQLTPVYGN
jgi:hypothetical protein